MKQFLGMLFGLGVVASLASATMVRRIDVNALVDSADLVFTGQALDSEVVFSRDGRFPFTFVTFSVDRTLKGVTEQRELTLRLHGGAAKNEVVLVAGMPQFTIGQSYLLFVKNNATSICPVLGWDQGKLQFQPEPSSGKTLLIDAQGAALQGLSNGVWARGPVPPASDAGVEYVDEVQSGLGSVRSAGRESTPASGTSSVTSGPSVEAGQVIASLEALIRSRSTLKSFKAGQIVRSASPYDVPDSVGGMGVARRGH